MCYYKSKTRLLILGILCHVVFACAGKKNEQRARCIQTRAMHFDLCRNTQDVYCALIVFTFRVSVCAETAFYCFIILCAQYVSARECRQSVLDTFRNDNTKSKRRADWLFENHPIGTSPTMSSVRESETNICITCRFCW